MEINRSETAGWNPSFFEKTPRATQRHSERPGNCGIETAAKPAQGLDTGNANNHKSPVNTPPSIHRDQILFSFLC
jgi:hypothetical protein